MKTTIFLKRVFWLLAVIGCKVFAKEHNARLVNTIQGPIRGYRDPLSDIFIFYNIPYATAPTGLHKFKAPLPPPNWTIPYEAVDQQVICPQADFVIDFKKYFNVQENCLVANIYVPDTEKTNLPVKVHVHGGAYQLGFGEMIKHKNLVKSDQIIAITFNYRLGVNGFLCLGTLDAPGNAGLKDQLALLRWVKKNIANFGGNPDDVTLSGNSAGSTAVDILMLSKTTEGLFNKVIPESGANIAVWSVQIDPLENAKAFARQLNFTNVDDVYALEEFYKTASIESLTSDSFIYKPDSTFVFVPCIERDTGVERILEDTPINILKQGKYKKVPMLYGFANKEGEFRVMLGYDQWKDKINEKFSDFLPADLQFDNDEEREDVAKKIKEFYFGVKSIGDDTILAYIDYFSDVMFIYPMLRAVKLHIDAGHDKIYLYEYSFPDMITSLTPKVLEDVKGAEHCAQTYAVADGVGMAGYNESVVPENYKKMKSVMREIWLNFITNGQPVPSGSSPPAWPPVMSKDCSPYMSLDEIPRLQDQPLQRRTLFWDEIYERHYRSPIPPPEPPPRSN